MGCDIHLFVEVRDGADSPWRLQAVRWQFENHKGELASAVGYDWRNYDVFGMLADVRNGRGFGGISTGAGFVPISQPRGLPVDMSDELKVICADDSTDDVYDASHRDYGCGWIGDHSHSHLSLQELQEYNWNQRTNKTGEVEAPGFKSFQETGAPEHWCGGVMGGAVRHVSNEAMQLLVESSRLSELATSDAYCPTSKMFDHIEWTPALEDLFAPRGQFEKLSFYTKVQWSVSYKEVAGDFHCNFIPAMAALGYAPDDTRIVFGFDS